MLRQPPGRRNTTSASPPRRARAFRPASSCPRAHVVVTRLRRCARTPQGCSRPGRRPARRRDAAAKRGGGATSFAPGAASPPAVLDARRAAHHQARARHRSGAGNRRTVGRGPRAARRPRRQARGTDVCDPYPGGADNLGLCLEELLTCSGEADADADGIPDRLDRCAATPGSTPVDAEGCSQAQFCGARTVRRECLPSDWLNDEPRRPRDCRWLNTQGCVVYAP